MLTGVKILLLVACIFNLPQCKDILVVNPMMSTYIKCSNYIKKLFLQPVSIKNIYKCSGYLINIKKISIKISSVGSKLDIRRI